MPAESPGKAVLNQDSRDYLSETLRSFGNLLRPRPVLLLTG